MAAVIEQSQQKKRKFTQTVELQIALKNYDPQKDKRFAGTVKYATLNSGIAWPGQGESWEQPRYRSVIKIISCDFSVFIECQNLKLLIIRLDMTQTSHLTSLEYRCDRNYFLMKWDCIYFKGVAQTAVTPVLKHTSYCSLALNHCFHLK